ncbi:MAG: hypothetical protein BWZ11_01406 [Bacteroidetes bacterium ADurb.BinA395]|nr:MAG: hypothetical protein BWZ11_01406 [Bacteroidetes bacterium ADurb.BinA395]
MSFMRYDVIIKVFSFSLSEINIYSLFLQPLGL